MEWSYPWLDMDGDRTYDDGDFAKFYANLFSTGVSLTTLNSLQVIAGSGMQVVVKTGAANIEGRSYLNSADLPLSIDIASSTQDRTDSIVVRMDKSLRVISIVVKKGDITVTRTADLYELQLAQVKVSKNSSSIAAANITDKRADDKVCGYSSPFQKVNVSGLENQYKDLLEKFFTALKSSTTEKETAFDAEIKRIIEENEDIRDEELINFQTWFNQIKSIIEGIEGGAILTELVAARKSPNGITYLTIGDRLDDELFSIESNEIESDITLIDDTFSKTHSVSIVESINQPSENLPIIIASIDDSSQNYFTFVKVGEV